MGCAPSTPDVPQVHTRQFEARTENTGTWDDDFKLPSNCGPEGYIAGHLNGVALPIMNKKLPANSGTGSTHYEHPPVSSTGVTPNAHEIPEGYNRPPAERIQPYTTGSAHRPEANAFHPSSQQPKKQHKAPHNSRLADHGSQDKFIDGTSNHRQPDDSVDARPPGLPSRDAQRDRSHKNIPPRHPTPIQAPRPDEVDHRRFDDYYIRGLDVRTIDTARNCRRLEAQYTFFVL